MSDAVRIRSDDLEIEVWPLGARLNGAWFRGSANLVEGSDTEDEARGAKKFNGATVGPVANRIAEGAASIDGRACVFERNENDITTLHAGTTGVHALVWSVAETASDTVSLTLDLEDGFGGFPGNRRLTATFSVEGDQMTVLYDAVTDAPTWINLALHPYWSLGVGRAGLQIGVNAEGYTPVDDTTIPTGVVAPVDGTIFDLRTPVPPSPEIDHNFDLTRRAGPGPAVTLQSDTLALEIETDAPGVQVYSGKEIGVAIEPQHWPDAMHHPGFPSIELRPGETYRQNSTYRFRSR